MWDKLYPSAEHGDVHFLPRLFTFAGGGASTGFNVSTAPSPHFTLNSAMYGAWAYNAVDNNAQIGTTAAGTGALYLFVGTGGNFVCSVNDNTNSSVAAPGTTGLFVCDRTSSSNIDLYWNGVKKASVGTASIGLQSVTMRVGESIDCCNSAAKISEAHFGASLGATLNLALYNRLAAYMAAAALNSVWSASDATANSMTLSNGGLTFAATTNAWQSIRVRKAKRLVSYMLSFPALL